MPRYKFKQVSFDRILNLNLKYSNQKYKRFCGNKVL